MLRMFVVGYVAEQGQQHHSRHHREPNEMGGLSHSRRRWILDRTSCGRSQKVDNHHLLLGQERGGRLKIRHICIRGGWCVASGRVGRGLGGIQDSRAGSIHPQLSVCVFSMQELVARGARVQDARIYPARHHPSVHQVDRHFRASRSKRMS